MNERIPIITGFYIQFTKDGRALSRGLEESQALPTALFWLRTHEGDRNHQLVQRWVQQKQQQIVEDVREQRIKAMREEINASVDRAARESNLRDRELIELVRAETLKAHGMPPAED